MDEQHFQPTCVESHEVSILDPQWNEQLTFTLHADAAVRTEWNQRGADDVLVTLVDWGNGALTLEFLPGTHGLIGIPDTLELTIDDTTAVDTLVNLIMDGRHYGPMPVDELATWNQLFDDEGHPYLEPGEADLSLPRLIPVRGIQQTEQ